MTLKKYFALLKNDDDETDEPVWVSKLGRAVLNCDRKLDAIMLLRDYFSFDPTYPEHAFQRHFFVSRRIFFDICSTLEKNNSFFRLRNHATGLYGLNCLHNCTSALRRIVYGLCVNLVDEYVRMGERTASDCLKEIASETVKFYKVK